MTCLRRMSQHPQRRREGDGGWIELTDGSRPEHADFALPHEITGSVARHYLLGCWLLAAEVRRNW